MLSRNVPPIFMKKRALNQNEIGPNNLELVCNLIFFKIKVLTYIGSILWTLIGTEFTLACPQNAHRVKLVSCVPNNKESTTMKLQILLLFAIFGLCLAHDEYYGQCPVLTPMSEFSWDKVRLFSLWRCSKIFGQQEGRERDFKTLVKMAKNSEMVKNWNVNQIFIKKCIIFHFPFQVSQWNLVRHGKVWHSV